MKIIFFNNERKITNEINRLSNPISYGFNEILWKNGGYADFTDRYVIINEEQDFKTLEENEILKQYKEQAKIEIAKLIEKNRVFFLANGTLSEKESDFIKYKETIDNAITEEELSIALEEILPKYKL